MTETTLIPLNQLIHSTANVRVTDQKDGISELTASIAAHGLRQNLNVRPAPKEGSRSSLAAGGYAP